MRDGIAYEEREAIAKIWKENVFSLLIDESTDISVSQILAVMVRYYDEKKSKVTDALLDIVEVDNASGEGLFKAVKELLASKDIPLQNINRFSENLPLLYLKMPMIFNPMTFIFFQRGPVRYGVKSAYDFEQNYNV